MPAGVSSTARRDAADRVTEWGSAYSCNRPATARSRWESSKLKRSPPAAAVAAGVALGSLGAFATARGKGGANLVDYVAEIFAERGQAADLDFVDALPSLADDDIHAGAGVVMPGGMRNHWTEMLMLMSTLTWRSMLTAMSSIMISTSTCADI